MLQKRVFKKWIVTSTILCKATAVLYLVTDWLMRNYKKPDVYIIMPLKRTREQIMRWPNCNYHLESFLSWWWLEVEVPPLVLCPWWGCAFSALWWWVTLWPWSLSALLAVLPLSFFSLLSAAEGKAIWCCFRIWVFQ